MLLHRWWDSNPQHAGDIANSLFYAASLLFFDRELILTSNAEKKLRDLLNVTATLLAGPKFGFPSAHPGNLIQPVEEWERITKEPSK